MDIDLADLREMHPLLPEELSLSLALAIGLVAGGLRRLQQGEHADRLLESRAQGPTNGSRWK